MAACSSSGGTDDPVPETAAATGVGSTNQIEGVVLNDVWEFVKEAANGVVSVTQGQFRLSIDDFIEATLVPARGQASSSTTQATSSPASKRDRGR